MSNRTRRTLAAIILSAGALVSGGCIIDGGYRGGCVGSGGYGHHGGSGCGNCGDLFLLGIIGGIALFHGIFRCR